jgi:ribosome-associated heat shock protein Hsp15
MGTDVLYEHVFPCQDFRETLSPGPAFLGQDEFVERVRLDKWLWAARFAKTRTAATDLVLAGHVKVGGERVKPAREIRLGDTLEILRGSVRHVVTVTGVAERRGSAKAAALLYEETSDSREKRERQALDRRLARPLGADLGARPTKLERRRLDALRRGQRRR